MKQIKFLSTLFLISFLTLQLSAQTQGSGYALSFDGTDDYVDFFSDDFVPQNTGFTVSMWLNIPDNLDMGRPISWYRCGADPSCGVGDAAVYWITVKATGEIEWLARDDSETVNSIVTTDTYLGNWVFITGVINQSLTGIKLYINGELKGASSNQMVGFTTGGLNIPFSMGRRYATGWGTPNSYFKGEIDEVRIWNRALSETEIRNNMNKTLTGNEDGLVAYYKMDEGADSTCPGGKDVCDKSGNGNHGTKQ